MIIKCSHCGYTKAVMESELMENDNCELCGGAMLFEQSADYLEEQKKEEIKNETEGMNEQIDNMLISSMINDIEKVGEEKVWWEINHSEIDLRLLLIPIYLESLRRIKESEK
jgi:hypothetical protein